MSGINDIVKVIIRLQTGGASVAGFGVQMIAGYHTLFSDRFRTFGSLSEMEDAGFDAEHGTLNGLIYKAAQAAFNQTPKPSLLAVGRIQANVIRLTVKEAVVGRVYATSVNGIPYSYTAVLADDIDDIATGLAALITAAPGVTSVATGTLGQYDITADVAGTFFSAVPDDNQTAAVQGGTNETFVTGLTAIQAASDEWYGLIITSRDAAIQEAVAGWENSSESPKFFRLASADANIANTTPASDTTTIMARLKALSYGAEVFYHTKADGTINDEFIDSAMMAVAFGYNPDVETATDKFKTLVGITPDKLTAAQRQNITGTEEAPTSGKNGNVYTTVRGKNIVQSGICSNGEWADILFGADWLKVRMEEGIMNALVANPKLPYTQDGIEALRSVLYSVLQKGQGTKFLDFDETLDKTFGFYVNPVRVRNVDSVDKANRIIKQLGFTARAAGAIHAAKPISGTIIP